MEGWVGRQCNIERQTKTKSIDIHTDTEAHPRGGRGHTVEWETPGWVPARRWPKAPRTRGDGRGPGPGQAMAGDGEKTHVFVFWFNVDPTRELDRSAVAWSKQRRTKARACGER